jgi:DNA-binding CsgD family transcriptional regulator
MHPDERVRTQRTLKPEGLTGAYGGRTPKEPARGRERMPMNTNRESVSTQTSAPAPSEVFTDAQGPLSMFGSAWEIPQAAGESLGDSKTERTVSTNGPTPGIVVFSASMELLYMSPDAWKMFGRINGTLASSSAQPDDSGTLTSVMRQCYRLIKLWRAQHDSGGGQDWWQLQCNCVMGSPDYPVLFRGFVIPDPAHPERSRILFIMDVMETWKNSLADAHERFHFTTREEEVVQHLLKGWTNKEIANALGIAEQTVKEHIKRILKKTQTATRTGILVRVLGLMNANHASTAGEELRAISSKAI